MAFRYSVRLSRRSVSVRPGFGWAAAARSSDCSSDADRGLVRRFIRPRQSNWRHLPRAHLPDDFFPRLRILRHIGGDEGVERQPAGFQAAVMAGNAIPIDDLAMRV